jgi:dienelactone hydrolase
MPRILLSLLLCLCSTVAIAAVNAIDPIDWSTWNEAPKTGESKGELKHPQLGSLVMKYRQFAPDRLPEKRTLGLVLCFHGLNSNEESMTGGVYWSFKSSGMLDDYVIAGGKSLGNGWGAGDEHLIIQYLDWLMQVYPIDPRRVFIYGHSNGGFMSVWFGNRHIDRFAGVVEWSGYERSIPAGKNPEATMSEYYLAHGDADPTVKVESSRGLRDNLKSAGFRFVYRETDGGDHGAPPEPVRRDIDQWINFLRHKQIAPNADEMAFLRDCAKGGETALANDDAWKELTRIGGPPAWATLAKVVKSKDPVIRRRIAELAGNVSLAGKQTVALLSKFATDEDAAVRSAAIAALKKYANWNDDDAQTTLAKIALAKKADPSDRQSAAEALAAALPLIFLGNFDDDDVLFQATVACLDSDLETVRAAMVAPLRGAVPDLFGYHADGEASARGGSIASWKKWFGERMGASAK